MSIYVDASFLVSLYCPDVNSVRALESLRAVTAVIYISTFAEFEFLNALELRVFRKEDPPIQSQQAAAEYEKDLSDGVFQLRALPANVFARASSLSRETTPRLGTRAPDILHVAAALELKAEDFFTFDRQQAKLAREVKLTVHPLS